MVVKYKESILAKGAEVEQFEKENLVVLFGDIANGGMEDYCYIIPVPKSAVDIRTGDEIVLGGQSYIVTAVGEKVAEHFSTMGHCTLCFDGGDEPTLPGTVHLRGAYPRLKAGDEIIIMGGN